MGDIREELKKTETTRTFVTVRAAEEHRAAAPVHTGQPEAMHENLQQEITEVLPMRRQVPAIPQVLQRVAEPMPEQPVPPGSLTYKQRRKLKKQDKEAKKKSIFADHVSLAIEEQLTEYFAGKAATGTAEAVEAATQAGVDVEERILRTFISGYRTDQQGRPLDEQEQQKKEQDEKFVADYCSGEIERRIPHLERIKNEMLKVRVSPDMLTEAYMEKHAGEVYDLASKLTCFENLQNNPVNAPYFENLPEVEKKLLDYRTKDICNAFGNLWNSVMASKGMSILNFSVRYVNAQSFYDAHMQKIPALREKLKNDLREADRKEEELRQETLMRAKAQGISDFNQAVQNSMPEPALDKTIGTEADYESLKSLIRTETHEEIRNGKKVQYKGLLELSDTEFEKNGEAPALQAFQIRESTKEAAKRDKELRGQFFTDIQKDYVKMFRNLEDAGVDFEAMSAKFERIPCGLGAYVRGGGIECIHEKMFANFRKYMEAPQAKEYVQKMISIIQDAKVFEGKKEKCVNFILQGLLNSYGANYVDVSKDAAYFGEHAQAARKVCMESCRNLLIMPRVVQMTEKDKENLPSEIKRLSEQYSQLLSAF